MGDKDNLKLTKRHERQVEERAGAKAASVTTEPDADFIRVEKQIIAAGFFTPTSKELKTTRVKTVALRRRTDLGEEKETCIRIVTGGDYGLPGTADLDKWLALQKLVNNIQRKAGVVINPICFSSWELLSMLGVHQRSGKNYEGVGEFLDRMVATTIEVSGEGIIDGQRRFGKDRIKVFDRAVSFGRELEPGIIADRNYVWLAAWQLENINNNYVLPVDFETYRELKNPIAKTLVPLLQIWLYASQSGSVFTKRYEELCQLLGIRQWKHASHIKQKLGPSLDELQKHGYIGFWGIEKRRGTEGYKLILKHGEKFFRDQAENQRRQGQMTSGSTEDEDNEKLITMLVERGVVKAVAYQLVINRAAGQYIEDQVEWIDTMIARKGADKFTNAPGLYVTLIKANAPIDPNFMTSRMRRLQRKYEERRREREEQNEVAHDDDLLLTAGDEMLPQPATPVDPRLMEGPYRDYVRQEVAKYISDLKPDAYEQLMAEASLRFKEQYREAAKVFKGAVADGVILGIAEQIAMPSVTVMTLEEFINKQNDAARKK